MNRAMIVEKCAPGLTDAGIAAKTLKVRHGKKMQVLCAIPWRRQRRCDGRATLEQYLQPHMIMGEIIVGDDDLPADPEGFTDDFRRLDQFLKGAEQKHKIKSAVGMLVEAFGDVALMHDKPALHAAGDQFGIFFHAFAGDVPGLNQLFEKRAVARAQIQYAGFFRNPLRDGFINAGIHDLDSDGREVGESSFRVWRVFAIKKISENVGERQVFDQE